MVSVSSSGKGPCGGRVKDLLEPLRWVSHFKSGQTGCRAALSLGAGFWSSWDKNLVSVFSAALPLPKPPICQQLGQEVGHLGETMGSLCHIEHGHSPQQYWAPNISALPQQC